MMIKRIMVIAGIVAIACVMRIFLSESLSLRVAAVFVSPKSAVMMKIKYSHTDNGVRVYEITKNIPVEKETGESLVHWGVHHIGPFCYAEYYGEA
jgi:hypothetical protein